MARMLGAVQRSWCWSCNKPPRSDCPDHGKSARQVKRREAAELRRYYDSVEVRARWLDFDDDMEGDPELVLGSDC